MDRDVFVTDDVLKQARQLGMYGNVRKRLTKMVEQSAPFTHDLGNRRYEGFVLLIEEKELKSIALLTVKKVVVPVGPIHRVRQEPDLSLVDCPVCGNDGGPCFPCNDKGKVTKEVSDELAADLNRSAQ